MKKPLLIGAAMILSFSVFYAFKDPAISDGGSQTIMVRAIQSAVKGQSKIFVFYGGNRTEVFELEKLGGNAESKNLDMIVSKINELNAQGYHIIDTTEGVAQGKYISFVLSKP